MDEKPKSRHIFKKTLIALMAVLVLVGIGFAVGWFMNRSDNNNPNNNNNTSTNTSEPTPTSNTSGSNVKSLISYTLPDGWNESICPNSSNTIYIIPNGSSLNCNANPSSPIKIYIDTQNTTDCQQLNPTSELNIKKHVCISLYINGQKSLKSLTEYSSDSIYKTDTTFSYYHVNTGKGVVALEYTYTSGNNYQVGFDQLSKSVKVKG
jgi:hypothetical protein